MPDQPADAVVKAIAHAFVSDNTTNPGITSILVMVDYA